MSAPLDVAVLARVPELLDDMERLKARVQELERQLAATTQQPANDLISVDEAVEISGRQREALYKLVQRGRLPAQRRGRALFIRRADAKALLARGRR